MIQPLAPTTPNGSGPETRATECTEDMVFWAERILKRFQHSSLQIEAFKIMIRPAAKTNAPADSL
jgi:hypothetical protein